MEELIVKNRYIAFEISNIDIAILLFSVFVLLQAIITLKLD